MTTEEIPNCNRCFIISATHGKGKVRRWFAFCKRTGKLKNSGPQETLHKALREIALIGGCDTCPYLDESARKSYIPLLNKKIQNQILKTLNKSHILRVLCGPVQSIVENRRNINLLFRRKFAVKFFEPVADDASVVVDISTPCTDEKDFVRKVQCIAGLIDRIKEKQVKQIILDEQKRTTISGPLNILETVLSENFPDFDQDIITNLRTITRLRNKLYPTHVFDEEALEILENMGFPTYPAIDWNEAWKKILMMCSISFEKLVRLLSKQR